MRRYRPTKRPDIPTDLVERYQAARDAGDVPGMDAVMKEAKAYNHMKDADTNRLIRGEELHVEFDRVRPEPPWEVGEILDVVNANWVVVCQAEVLEADPPAYTLRGRLLGDVGD